MVPIVEYPSVVSSHLPSFEQVFTKPQMKNFARYTSGLMISPNHTISAMNDLFFAHNDQSALNNFITDSTWSDDELDKARYRIVLDGLNQRKDAQGEGILVMDDTLSHKSGKKMEFAGSFFDHTEGTYTWAHDIVTTNLVRGRFSLPLDLQVYIKQEQLNEQYLTSVSRLKSEQARQEYAREMLPSESFKDKNQIARELIQKAAANGVPFEYVIGDSWFFNLKTTALVESLKKDWIFGCKSDRVVLMSQGWVHLSDWARTIPKEKFAPVKVWYEREHQTYWCYCANLVMRSMGERRVRVLVSYDNPELNGEPRFLCTNKLMWDAHKILKVYAKRGRIDAFYRDAKQSLGMEDYELRKIRGVRRHLTMVFITHTLLTLGSASRSVGDAANQANTISSSQPKLANIDVARAGVCLDTIGSGCRFACIEVLTSFIRLVLRLGRRVNDARKITMMALSSRARLGMDFAKV